MNAPPAPNAPPVVEAPPVEAVPEAPAPEAAPEAAPEMPVPEGGAEAAPEEPVPEEMTAEGGADPEQMIQEILDKVTALEAKVDQIVAALPAIQKGGKRYTRRGK
jgi:hypothetical protein